MKNNSRIIRLSSRIWGICFLRRRFSIEKATELRVNRDITVSEVRLIGSDGKQAGIVTIEQALNLAAAADMDLVEISPTAKPVVCKILDYGKYKYRESKKRHEARVRQKQVEVKEIKFRLIISTADYQVKLRNALRFLQSGNRVKVSLWFRGREISKSHLGFERLKKFFDDLSEHADIEQEPNIEGKRLHMLLGPKRQIKGVKNAKTEN